MTIHNRLSTYTPSLPLKVRLIILAIGTFKLGIDSRQNKTIDYKNAIFIRFRDEKITQTRKFFSMKNFILQFFSMKNSFPNQLFPISDVVCRKYLF